MRRGLIALLIVGLVLPPMLEVRPVAAQVQLNTYPSGPVDINNTTVTVANTAAATTLYTKSIPPRYFQNLKQPLAGAGALHLVLLGTITTNQGVSAPSSMNIGCNYGGTTASIALVNGIAPVASLVAAPWRIDLWLRTQGTSTTSEFLFGEMNIAGTQALNASQSVFNAAVTGTTSITANQTLACIMQWSSAAATNSLTVNSAVLGIGQ